MEKSILYFPFAPNTRKALAVLFDSMTERLDSPQATLTVGEAVPLFAAMLELSSKLEETLVMHGQRLAICETAVSLSKDLDRSKSSRPERVG
jgi:hypothetical protein